MKTIHKLLILLAISFVYSSCNDEWKDELYVKMVSLKARYDNQGVTNIYLRYQPDGEVIYQLPVIVSGSQQNDRSLDVHIGVDNDTLAILNEERYKLRTDLYYKQLPEQFYELMSPTCHIPAGSDKETYNIKFKFNNLDLVEKWVLPLTIEENPSYTTNKFKGNRKALLRVMPFNDYSGVYSSTNMQIHFADDNDNPMVMGSRTAWVVDENTIFFYAGVTEEEDINRSTYKIFVKFLEDGKLDVRAENDEIGFKLTDDPTYEVKLEDDTNIPYLRHRYVTIRLKYTYNDITSVKTFPIGYRAEGSMIMERKINTLIPDRDQAIQW